MSDDICDLLKVLCLIGGLVGVSLMAYAVWMYFYTID